MNEYIKLYDKRRKEKLKEREITRKKLNSLSLVEKNAYEQIIERYEGGYRYSFYLPFQILFYLGLFSIILSIIYRVPFETFRPAFVILLKPFIILTLILIVVDSLKIITNPYFINKLALKLLR